jgi:hypothetical protein
LNKKNFDHFQDVAHGEFQKWHGLSHFVYLPKSWKTAETVLSNDRGSPTASPLTPML